MCEGRRMGDHVARFKTVRQPPPLSNWAIIDFRHNSSGERSKLGGPLEPNV